MEHLYGLIAGFAIGSAANFIARSKWFRRKVGLPSRKQIERELTDAGWIYNDQHDTWVFTCAPLPGQRDAPPIVIFANEVITPLVASGDRLFDAMATLRQMVHVQDAS